MSRYDGLIIPRSYNDYFSRARPDDMKQFIRTITQSTVDPAGTDPVNGTAVNGALANYEKLYTSLSQLGISTSKTTVANVWDKLPNNAEAKLDRSLFTDTMPNTDSAFILFEKLSVARGKITYYTKDSNNTYLMCLNSSNAPSGTWEKLTIESDVQGVKSVFFTQMQVRNTKFSIETTKWFCGVLCININGSGNWVGIIDVRASDDINLTRLGGNIDINSIVDVTINTNDNTINFSLKNSVPATNGIKSITMYNSI